jgi:rare lipoprotein A
LTRSICAALIFACSVAQVQAFWVGEASYYRYSRHSGLFAAHRTLPFGTQVRVTNLGNGRSAIVTIVDRGPFIRGRIIDVSTGAAEALDFRRAGVARVRVEVVAQEQNRGDPWP